MEFSGHIALNSENMPQLVRPILFACVKINVEESDFFCPPEFHFHLFSSLVVAPCTGGDLFACCRNRRAVHCCRHVPVPIGYTRMRTFCLSRSSNIVRASIRPTS